MDRWDDYVDAKINEVVNSTAFKYRISTNINLIVHDIIDLYKLAIQRRVYDLYVPEEYKRTFQLKNNINYKLDGNVLFVYNDTKISNHYSAQTGEKVAHAVPYWIQSGHNHSTLKRPMYHQYVSDEVGNFIGGRNYLELAKELVEDKYGIEVEIINDPPS